jgi:hypothetical protein
LELAGRDAEITCEYIKIVYMNRIPVENNFNCGNGWVKNEPQRSKE